MNPRAIISVARISLVVVVAVIVHLATTDRSYPVIERLWDKGNHALAFAVLSLLLDFSFPGKRFGPAKIAALLGFGLSIEGMQYLLPHRVASLLDVLADAVGIALYVPCIPLIARVPMLQRARKD